MFSKTSNLQHSVMFSLVCRIVQEALFSNGRIPWGITCLTVYFSVPVFVISNLPSHLGKSWSSSFDCFNGFISLIITQLRASPCENTQEAFYTFNKLIVAVLFLTRILLVNPFQISNTAQIKDINQSVTVCENCLFLRWTSSDSFIPRWLTTSMMMLWPSLELFWPRGSSMQVSIQTELESRSDHKAIKFVCLSFSERSNHRCLRSQDESKLSLGEGWGQG